MDLSKLKWHTGLGLEEEEEQIANPAVQASILATCRAGKRLAEEGGSASEIDIMGDPESDADSNRHSNKRTGPAVERLPDSSRHTDAQARITAHGLAQGFGHTDAQTDEAMMSMLNSFTYRLDRLTALTAETDVDICGVNDESDADQGHSPHTDIRRSSTRATADPHDESAAKTHANTDNTIRGAVEGRGKRICRR